MYYYNYHSFKIMGSILPIRAITTFVMASIFVLYCTGCGSTRISNSKSIALRSVPDSALVTYNSIPVGVTPMALTVNTSHQSNIVFSKEGYNNATCELIPERDESATGGKVLAGVGIGVLGFGLCALLVTGLNEISDEDTSISPACLAPLGLGILFPLIGTPDSHQITKNSCDVTLQKKPVEGQSDL